VPDLPYWLTVGVALIVLGLVAVLDGRRVNGFLLLLAGLVLNLAALVRFAVLPAAGIVTLLTLVILVTVLLMVVVIVAVSRDPS
jgi:predicted neutral ceramidase superfamily lipid hydrolase